ncbi:MAG: SUMF1/EgtB/PvdO family nonheme iron enzyme [Chloroflexota bacterium]|nr:SUMF1/EgtB/PvdO family nonheme iron enzyme [Chloroflexota bacterium]
MTPTKVQLDLIGADADAGTLFISYARKDVEFAQRLNADLQRHGVITWIDELGIRSGEDWPNRIATAIEGCKAMLVILSPDSMASRWVRRELAFADTKSKRLLPLLYRPCKLSAAFELRFGNVQRADFSRGDYETNLVELLVSIRQVLGLAVTTPSPPVQVKQPERKPDVLTITSPIHLELVRVPAGEFLMGGDKSKDKKAYDYEQPQHRLHVSEFYIGKYPVTNAQYAAFVRATKQQVPRHWKKGKIPSGKGNHPVVYVAWYDALAFCEWLSRETGKDFCLPTEAEWEKAARGTGGRIYPWGNGQPTAELCNFGNNIGRTTPVGQYSPQGDSPYGCADMAGNVWEWTRSLWGKDWAKPDFGYPYNPTDGRENLKAEVLRVLRGGSFVLDRHLARCAFRVRGRPERRLARLRVSGGGLPHLSCLCSLILCALALWNPGPFGFVQGRL